MALAAFQFLSSFDPKRSAFSTWLFTIARNRCRNELARRRPVVGAELPDVVDLRSSASMDQDTHFPRTKTPTFLAEAERTCITMRSASRLTDQAQIPNPFKAKWFGSGGRGDPSKTFRIRDEEAESRPKTRIASPQHRPDQQHHKPWS